LCQNDRQQTLEDLRQRLRKAQEEQRARQQQR
jgi:hypothetical protein